MEGGSVGKQIQSIPIYACVACGDLFQNKNYLLRHERIHDIYKSLTKPGEKSFVCRICRKTFLQRSSLDEHRKIHSGDNPYKCDICEKTFTQTGTLDEHKRIHTGEKPYACEICKKTFRKSGNLTEHKRVHTGEKPYSCDVCQKSYSRSSGLINHNKTAIHIEKIKNRNTNLPLTHSSIVDCNEAIKEEDIKKEINEEESVDDPLSIHQDIEKSNVCEDIKKEVKEEESVDNPISIQEGKRRSENKNIYAKVKDEGIDDDTLFVQALHNSRNGENKTVVDDIDIVEHKIDFDH